MQKVVLIIEDDDRQARWYGETLEASGATVFSAASLASAQGLVVSHPEADVIIIDGVLPETDGTQAGTAITSLPLIREIREQRGFDVYLIGASRNPLYCQQMLEAGCNAQCGKHAAAQAALKFLGLQTPRQESA